MTFQISEHRFQSFYILTIILGFGISAYFAHHQILSGDQIQMLYKGYLASNQDIWLHYGNAASAMGNVPGTLSTLLIALPLKVFNSPWSPMLLLLGLRLIGFYLFDTVIKQIFSIPVRLLFLIGCWLNPWFQFESLLYNPAYLFFCAALHFWSAFHLRKECSFFHSLLHILSIGLAAQLHYSWPLLCVISAFLFFKHELKIHWGGVLSGVSLILLSLIPYFMAIATTPAILHNTDPEATTRYIGWGGLHIYPVLKSFVYWLRYASLLYPNKLITGASFDWIASHETIRHIALYLWRGITFFIGGLTLLLAFMINRFCWIKLKPLLSLNASKGEWNDIQWCLLFSAGAVIAVLISAALSPIVLIYWHLMLVFPFALIPVLVFAEHKQKFLFKTPTFLVSLAIYFLVINLVAANDSKKFSYKANYSEQTITYVLEQKL